MGDTLRLTLEIPKRDLAMNLEIDEDEIDTEDYTIIGAIRDFGTLVGDVQEVGDEAEDHAADALANHDVMEGK